MALALLSPVAYQLRLWVFTAYRFGTTEHVRPGLVLRFCSAFSRIQSSLRLYLVRTFSVGCNWIYLTLRSGSKLCLLRHLRSMHSSPSLLPFLPHYVDF